MPDDKKTAAEAIREPSTLPGSDPPASAPDPAAQGVRSDTPAAQNAPEDQRQQLREELQQAIDQIIENTDFDKLSARMDEQRRRLNEYAQILRPADKMPPEDLRQSMRAVIDHLQAAQATIDEFDALEPYIKAELKKSKYNGASFEDFLDVYTWAELAEPPEDSTLYIVLKKARDAKAKKEAKKTAEQLPTASYKSTEDLQTSTTKLTSVFYSVAAPIPKSEINGQRKMVPLGYEAPNSKKEITVFYDFVYNEKLLNELQIDKGFDYFDFFVMSVLDNLKLEGNSVVSVSKIFREMGNSGDPGAKHKEEILKSLQKGLSTVMHLDDREAQIAWGNIDEKTRYNEIISPIMPVQIKNERTVFNGGLTDTTVYINSISPFMALSQTLGQFTTWNKDVLRLYPGKRTRRYYNVLHFLMGQIGWMRHGGRNNKITYDLLHKHTGAKTARDRQLDKEMLYKLLDTVFIPGGDVTNYKEDDNRTLGVIVYCTCNKALPDKKK